MNLPCLFGFPQRGGGFELLYHVCSAGCPALHQLVQGAVDEVVESRVGRFEHQSSPAHGAVPAGGALERAKDEADE